MCVSRFSLFRLPINFKNNAFQKLHPKVLLFVFFRNSNQELLIFGEKTIKNKHISKKMFFLPKHQNNQNILNFWKSKILAENFEILDFPQIEQQFCLLGKTFGSRAKFWSGQKFKNCWFWDFLLFHQVEHNIFTGWLRWAVPVSKIVVRH